MSPRSLLVSLTLCALLAPQAVAQAKKQKPKPPPPPELPADPPLAAWTGTWHTGATVQYSSCPGTEPGHQEAFTLAVIADEKAITATETPEQSLPRKYVGQADQRTRRWVLLLRDKEGKNGMDLWLDDDGKNLAGTRVVVRQVKKSLCSVVYVLEGLRDEAI